MFGLALEVFCLQDEGGPEDPKVTPHLTPKPQTLTGDTNSTSGTAQTTKQLPSCSFLLPEELERLPGAPWMLLLSQA